MIIVWPQTCLDVLDADALLAHARGRGINDPGSLLQLLTLACAQCMAEEAAV